MDMVEFVKRFCDWDIVRDASGMPTKMELRRFGYVAEYRVRWINPRGQIRERWFLDYNTAINFAARFPYERVVVEGPVR